jgi:mRNA-degrading endonuclease RelE of RelBE toxin-antitoxin system
MQLIYTAHFKKDYKKLSDTIQKKTDEKIKLLVENLSHPKDIFSFELENMTF